MNVETIKDLIRSGDIPQASEKLREILAKTPEDAAARMLYGTCCQLMGDSATFGRIYRDLAPEMELRVTRGERSELVSMWLKYAAMFAVVVSCFYGALGEDAALNISNATNATGITSKENDKDVYDCVMKMSSQDRLRYFMNRPEVRRELNKGDVRAVVIQLDSAEKCDDDDKKDDREKTENLMLIRASSSLKTGADVLKALGETDGTDKFMSFQKNRADNGVTDFCENNSFACRAKKKVFQVLGEHGDISDLIVSLDEQESHVIGICYVNYSASPRRLCTRYAGPRDNGERLPKYVIAPDGKVLYELTEEMVREEFRKRQMKREVFF